MLFRQKMLSDRSGNVAIMSALLLVPAVAILGSGYDLIRATTASTQLQMALEGAALASASLSNQRQAELVITEYVRANLARNEELLASLDIDFDEEIALNSKTISITARAAIPTTFMRLAGVNQLSASASTVANQSATDVEIALVLDVSSSMHGSKIASLKDAASGFIDAVLTEDNIDRTSISLIPYGSNVNVGESIFNYLAPTTAAGVLNPTQAQYMGSTSGNNKVNPALATGLFRFSDAGYCVEYVNNDFNDDALTSGASRSQMPHFWKWNNFSPFCPTDSSSVLFNSNNVTALKTKITGFTLHDGTGSDIGALWGVRALSPNWASKIDGDFPDRPGAFNQDGRMKVMVLMTDGEITEQYRPRDRTRLNTHTDRPTNNTPTVNPVSNQGDNKNQQRVWTKGAMTDAANADTAVSHLKRVCDFARANGIVVYTIGFQIDTTLAEDTLKYCASDISKYYLVESLDIQSAFDSIAASVNALRITG
jgi:Flp pilus assembly protein TadG